MHFNPSMYAPRTDDLHWVIDTDYENYAVHYSCREIDYDGTCLDGYSFIFSRHPTGLRAEDQRIVTQRKTELCLLGKYRRVEHNGTYSRRLSIWQAAEPCWQLILNGLRPNSY